MTDLSEEDRARLGQLRNATMTLDYDDRLAIVRALALIDHLEARVQVLTDRLALVAAKNVEQAKALEAADKLARFVVLLNQTSSGATLDDAAELARAYRSTRTKDKS